MFDIFKGIGFLVIVGVLIIGFIRLVWNICTTKDTKPKATGSTNECSSYNSALCDFESHVPVMDFERVM